MLAESRSVTVAIRCAATGEPAAGFGCGNPRIAPDAPSFLKPTTAIAVTAIPTPAAASPFLCSFAQSRTRRLAVRKPASSRAPSVLFAVPLPVVISDLLSSPTKFRSTLPISGRFSAPSTSRCFHFSEICEIRLLRRLSALAVCPIGSAFCVVEGKPLCLVSRLP